MKFLERFIIAMQLRCPRCRNGRLFTGLLQNDDAMAAGVIGTILSLAFMTLLSLTVAVNVWMQSMSR